MISAAAADNASRRVSRTADSSGAVQTFGECLCVFSAGFGSHREFVAKVVDVRCQVHGTTMAPL